MRIVSGNIEQVLASALNRYQNLMETEAGQSGYSLGTNRGLSPDRYYDPPFPALYYDPPLIPVQGQRQSKHFDIDNPNWDKGRFGIAAIAELCAALAFSIKQNERGQWEVAADTEPFIETLSEITDDLEAKTVRREYDRDHFERAVNQAESTAHSEYQERKTIQTSTRLKESDAIR